MRLTEYFVVRQGKAKRRLRGLDARKVYSRATGWHPNSIGPLDPRYTTTGLTRQQRAAGRMCQLLAAMRKAYERGDRQTFDSLIRPLDRCAAAIEGSGWGHDVRELTFPLWTT